MPRGKRPPIEYTPQFGAGIFRPKDAVEQDLAELEVGADAPNADGQAAEPDAAPPRQRQVGSERSSNALSERTNVRTNERTRVRHSFDVWQDQLLALTQIQAERFNRTGRKPKLGELVQEALDGYIAQQRKRTNVRTNER